MTKEVISTQAREHAHSLTVWAWVLLLLKATGITCGLVIEAVKALSSKRRNGFGYYPYLAYKGMRDYQSGLNAIGIQNLLPSTSKTCKQFAKKHKLQQSTIQLSDGSVALWLGQREASKIIISFHGGGYMAPILSSHLSLAFGFAKNPQIDRKNVAVVVLQYDLACEDANHYPRQLQQAVTLLDNLLLIQKISPSRITLIGDSAGAHLLISLLLHIRHANPRVPQLDLDGHISGAVIISPWLEMSASVNSESMQSNINKDILHAPALAYWAQNFMGAAIPDAWNSPLTAPDDWWSDLPVDHLLIMFGENELIRDDVSTLTEKIKSRHARTTATKFAGEFHVQMVMNHFLQVNAPCESKSVFVKWLNEHLSST